MATPQWVHPWYRQSSTRERTKFSMISNSVTLPPPPPPASPPDSTTSSSMLPRPSCDDKETDITDNRLSCDPSNSTQLGPKCPKCRMSNGARESYSYSFFTQSCPPAPPPPPVPHSDHVPLARTDIADGRKHGRAKRCFARLSSWLILSYYFARGSQNVQCFSSLFLRISLMRKNYWQLFLHGRQDEIRVFPRIEKALITWQPSRPRYERTSKPKVIRKGKKGRTEMERAKEGLFFCHRPIYLLRTSKRSGNIGRSTGTRTFITESQERSEWMWESKILTPSCFMLNPLTHWGNFIKLLIISDPT